ncbi:cysteine hydrolase family protein [Arenibaculum pallidiluteum]|uniref:cysteine hydrolase family protein n=1 Tax=Arenibaculum pallidiluteum TaxID=2812559 RepID=UPI001A957DCC|nr:cysteine hydrolase family protein [Arenibaculum pallidiluteum]
MTAITPTSAPTSASGRPQTLLEIAGASPRPAGLAEAVLVIVDAQVEYVSGRLPLAGIEAAVAETARLLSAARAAGTPVIHIVQHTAPGRPIFDPETRFAQIVPELTPVAGEEVIVKRLPNSFAGTPLAERLAAIAAATGRKSMLLAGFMTHMCVSATARAALDLGIPVTVVAGATATRDLPSPLGGVIPAQTVHETALAELADRFATVVADTQALAVPAGA